MSRGGIMKRKVGAIKTEKPPVLNRTAIPKNLKQE